MSRIMRRVSYGVVLIALMRSSVLLARPPRGVLPAPVPPQIAAAKHVFISYAGVVGAHTPQDDRVYDQFYAAMKSWARYEFVAAPSDADLVLEASVIGVQVPQFRLAILDPKTHVVLWAFTERVNMGGFTNHTDFDKAITKIVDDFKNLDARTKAAAAESVQK